MVLSNFISWLKRVALWLKRFFPSDQPERCSSTTGDTSQREHQEGRGNEQEAVQPGNTIAQETLNQSVGTKQPNKKGPSEANGSVDATSKKHKGPLGGESKTGTQKPYVKKTSIGPDEEKKERKETTTRVESPFIEIDLEKARVFLVLPGQQVRLDDTVTGILQQLNYQLELNSETKTVPARVTKSKQGALQVEEKRVELEKPLQGFRIAFLEELKGTTYEYKHDNVNIFIFSDTGGHGRMHWLYSGGGINPIPQKVSWILINKNYKLETHPDMEDNRFVWEDYQIFRVNLKEEGELVVTTATGEKTRIPCKAPFSIECEQSVDDDFRDQRPLFTGKVIKIKAPRENPDGWIVWIQNRKAGSRIITGSWKGIYPLELKLPEDLPCECGEFQVDICKKGERIPVETLFFRYVSSLKLFYTKELIVPDADEGHKQEIIKVFPGSNLQEWQLNQETDSNKIGDCFEIKLPPEDDCLNLFIAKIGKPETEVNLRINIPRLKWRTSGQVSWNCKPLQIKRDTLVPGRDFYLYVRTNDFNTKYYLRAILEEKGERRQEARFKLENRDYNLLLNQFYDTVKRIKDILTLNVQIEQENQSWQKCKVLNISTPVFKCKLCNDSESYDEQGKQSHIKEFHLAECVRPLTLEELREYVPGLPHGIYKCSFCNYYSREEDPLNPTSLIIKHTSFECPQGRHKQFKVIQDPVEIGEKVIPDYPKYYKCALCGKDLLTSDLEEHLDHLLKNHEEKCYSYE